MNVNVEDNVNDLMLKIKIVLCGKWKLYLGIKCIMSALLPFFLLEHIRFHIDDLKKQCLQGINKDQFLYVEGAGGFYSPLCSDGLNKDLAKVLGLSIVLVVNDRVGCINHTLLSIEAIEKSKLSLLAIVLNKVDNTTGDDDTGVSAMDNQADLQKRCKYPIISIAHNQESSEPFEKILSEIFA